MDDIAHERPPSPVPAPVPAPVSATELRNFKDRIQGLEDHVSEQGRWINHTFPRLTDEIREMQDSIATLSRRMDEMEEYMGFRPQPLVLYNGEGELHYFPGGPSWRRRGMEVDEDEEDAQAAILEEHWHRAAAADAGSEQDGHEAAWPEEDGRGAAPAPAGLGVDNGHGAAAAPTGLEEDGRGTAPAPAPAPAPASRDDERPPSPAPAPAPAPAPTALGEDGCGATPAPTGPLIKVVPATPQDSQESVQRMTSVDVSLPRLLQHPSIPNADPVEPVTVSTSNVFVPTAPPSALALHSPHPSPPPQLRRSPRHLSPALPSRSTTPQPNPNKRVGTSNDREEVKRGRKK
jgi:hypothetical protein